MKRFIAVIMTTIIMFTAFSSAFAAIGDEIHPMSDNESTIYSFLKDTMGINTAAACGVLANIECESNFNPNALGDGGTSYGICQWHESRWDDLKNYCANNGYDYTTLTGQLYFLNYELQLPWLSTVYNTLHSVQNSEDGAYSAGYTWCYYFERPANIETQSVTRGNLAKSTYWAKYNTENTYADNMVTFAYSQLGKTGADYASLGVSFDWCVWFTTYCAYNTGICGSSQNYTSSVFPPFDRNTWQACNWAATGVVYQANWFVNNSKGTLYKFSGDYGLSGSSNIISSDRTSVIPQPGDLVYFDWEHDNDWNHVALVCDYDLQSGIITYIGGNQGDGSSYSTRVVSERNMYRTSQDYAGLMRVDYSAGGDPKQLSISGAVYPTGDLTLGKPFDLYGVITSPSNITSVTVGAFNRDGTPTSEVVTETPYTTSFNIQTVDTRIRFNYLSKGNYTYKVTATNATETRTLISSDFTIDGGVPISFIDVNATYRINVTEGVNMRSGYGLSASVIGGIPYNAEVYVTKITAEEIDGYIWANTSYNGVTGWYAFKYSEPVAEPAVYEVEFFDWNGTRLSVQTVEEGQAAIAPADPHRDGYRFIGWDKDFSCVNSDLQIYALYEKIVLVGDANGDGVTNTLDAVIILRYMAGWSVKPDLTAADVDSNGTVNTLDAVYVLRYVAGWSLPYFN